MATGAELVSSLVHLLQLIVSLVVLPIRVLLHILQVLQQRDFPVSREAKQVFILTFRFKGQIKNKKTHRNDIERLPAPG